MPFSVDLLKTGQRHEQVFHQSNGELESMREVVLQVLSLQFLERQRENMGLKDMPKLLAREGHP
jgi:hypothetical protein